jgi:hypothetical protein
MHHLLERDLFEKRICQWRSWTLLTILTTSFWPSKSRKRGGYKASFIHVSTNKVPRVVL